MALCNACERIFSHARKILSYQRRAMTPQHLNDHLMLTANRKLWNRHLINDIVCTDGNFKPKKAVPLYALPEDRRHMDELMSDEDDDY